MKRLQNLQPFYYSGSKWSKAETILPHIVDGLRDNPDITEYREAFFGSGAIGINLLGRLPRQIRYWFNDLDPPLACFWFAVRDFPDEFIAAITAYQPDVTRFAAVKKRLMSTYRVPPETDAGNAELIEIAVQKIALHQLSHHGYGAGVRGGIKQEQPERNHLTGRWRPAEIVTKIRAISGHFGLRQVHLSQGPCWRLVEDVNRRALVYCDMPYLYATPLYMRKFTLLDHERLAETLRRSPHAFAVSHRINTKIRDLYAGWAEIREVDSIDYLIMRWS